MDGINAVLSLEADRLPPEFRLPGITPEPWQLSDAFGVLSAVPWFFRSNYAAELLYLTSGRHLIALPSAAQ